MQVILANPGMVPPAEIVVPPPHQPLFNHGGNNMAPPQTLVGHGGGQTAVRDPQQQDFQEAQQIILASREQQQMFRNYEHQVFGGFEPSNGGFGNQGELLSPSLAHGNFGNVGAYQMQQGEQHPIEAQLLLSPQQGQPHQQQQCESEDGRNVLDFSIK